MTSSNTGAQEELDLDALAARLTERASYTYTFDDAKQDMRSLISWIETLEERQAAVAHLIKLAISHGVSPAALDRLNDALDELEPAVEGEPPGGKAKLVAHWATERRGADVAEGAKLGPKEATAC
jgi:hypothetical protein